MTLHEQVRYRGTLQ